MPRERLARRGGVSPTRAVWLKFRAFLTVLGASILIMGAGTLGYVIIEGARPFDALYMTVITVATIGYGEIFPLSDAGRAFTMVLAFAGIGIILVTATEVARVVLEGDLRKLLGFPREVRMIKRMHDHIIVAGLGRMGRSVVEVLDEQGVPHVIVDLDLERCRPLVEVGKPVVHGDATHPEALEAAGIQRARTFIACLRDDANNVYAILLARQLNPGITIIARAVEEDAESRLRLAGAHRVINPYRLGGMRLAHTALKPTVVDFLEESLRRSGVDVELGEVRMSAQSELAGLSLASAGLRQRYGVIVVALKRAGGTVFNPDAGTKVEPGDVMVVLGPAQSIARLILDAGKG